MPVEKHPKKNFEGQVNYKSNDSALLTTNIIDHLEKTYVDAFSTVSKEGRVPLTLITYLNSELTVVIWKFAHLMELQSLNQEEMSKGSKRAFEDNSLALNDQYRSEDIYGLTKSTVDYIINNIDRIEALHFEERSKLAYVCVKDIVLPTLQKALLV